MAEIPHSGIGVAFHLATEFPEEVLEQRRERAREKIRQGVAELQQVAILEALAVVARTTDLGDKLVERGKDG